MEDFSNHRSNPIKISVIRFCIDKMHTWHLKNIQQQIKKDLKQNIKTEYPINISYSVMKKSQGGRLHFMGNQRDSRPDKVEPLYITEEMACDDVMDEKLQKQIKKEATRLKIV